MTPTIIEVALSGFGGKARNPNNPVSPAEVSADLLACMEAGAAILHNHLDDYGLTGSTAAARYGEGWKTALAARPDAIVYPTLAADDGSALGKYAHGIDCVTTYGARMGVLDTGSINLTGGSTDGTPSTTVQIAYVNDYALIDRVLSAYSEHAIAPSIAVYDPTFLRATIAYQRVGRLTRGAFVKLYFGGDHSYLDGRRGVSFGLPPTLKALDAYLEMLHGSGLVWAAALLGGDLLAHREFAREVLDRGGHLRVGLEDYAGERTPSNRELVAEAAALAREAGRPPASCAEAARMLDLPR
jgi:3-keto-5-aminohexanoate cleavage enzyme